MQVHLSISSLGITRWYEYLIHFALGGAATVLTGIISTVYGASIGGLFLAVPAIFCASATLIERHEIRRKKDAGMKGTQRGLEAAALEAAGGSSWKHCDDRVRRYLPCDVAIWGNRCIYRRKLRMALDSGWNMVSHVGTEALASKILIHRRYRHCRGTVALSFEFPIKT